MMWEETGLPESTESKAEVMTVKCSAAVKDFEYTNTKAEAGVANAKAGTSASPTLLEASASASGLNVSADVGTKHLGAYASAEVVTVREEAGIAHTPLQVRAQGPAAGAEAGVSWDTGVGVGASLAEARGGPFAARAGVRNGAPEVDLGPVTAPCSIM